jgi:diacylglycerol kinase (ATP)
MPRHIIYIINPISGTRTKKDLQQIIEERTTKAGIKFQVFPSVANADYSFLHSIIQEEKVTDVVIAGGDGTVSQVVSGLMQFELNFGILPCGSGNGLAYTAKIPKQPEKALDIIFKGNSSLIDGFYVNRTTPHGTEKQFACMLCGLGFDAKVAHEFARQPKRGLATYAKLIGKNFFSAHPYSFVIESNGVKFSPEAYFISIANSNQFGNNFTIAPQASFSDGLLDIVIVKKTGKPLLLLNIIIQVLGGRIRKIETSLKMSLIYFQSEKIKITNLSQAPLHIDGDPLETSEKITIEVKKKCFRLIQP